MNMTKKTEIFLPKTKTNFVLFNKQQSRETTFDTFIFKNCRRKLINNCISYFLDAGSLTVLRRTSSKTKVGSVSSSRTSLSTENDSYASVDLGVDKLPPTDTPDASHVCSIR